MTITVISKHLPLAFKFFHSPAGPRVLNLLHLVESARYHFTQFRERAASKGHAPKDFESGLDIDIEKLDRYYQFMAVFIELESFLSSAKRFMDHSWCCIGEPFGKGAEKIRTLGGAIFKMQKHVVSLNDREEIRKREYFSLLEIAYATWGDELAKVRNYIEHIAPLGGMAYHYKIIASSEGQVVDPFLPDRLPGRNENITKENLSYRDKRSTTKYIKETMINLDNLLASLLQTEEPLLFIDT